MSTEVTSLKLWLRLQCQMITGVSEGLLVCAAQQQSPVVVAKWPANLSPAGTVNSTIKAVLEKRVMQLFKEEDGAILLGHPIELNKQFWGVVVLKLSVRDHAGVAAATRLLKWGEAWLQYTLHKEGKAPTESVHAILAKVAEEPSLAEAVISLVNYVASYLDAKRVCCGLVRDGDVHIQAVSFSAHFDTRTPAMQRVKYAMREALQSASNIICSLDQKAGAHKHPAHYQLLDEAVLGRVVSLRLMLNTSCIVVLQIEFSEAEDELSKRLDSLVPVLPLFAQAIHLKERAGRGVGTRIKAKLARGVTALLGRGHWWAKFSALACVVFLVMMLLPATFRVSGEAVLQGTQKHVVVASQDGYLATVNVRPGDIVAAKDVLAQMDDNDLRLQRRKLISELQQHRHTYNNALASSLRAQAAIASAQVEQATIQLELIEQQLTRTLLRSPIDGIVVSEDVSQSVGAPVSQGTQLFEIVTNQQYRVVLYVDERDVAFIQKEQQGRLVLTSLPSNVFHFSVQRVTPLSEVRDGRNMFRVDANLLTSISAEQHSRLLKELRPGMTGTGKVHIGSYRRGWILFHGLLDWLRLRFWW